MTFISHKIYWSYFLSTYHFSSLLNYDSTDNRWSFTLDFSAFFFFFFFVFFRAAPAAYGSSQARGWIEATAAGLHHSHSNAEPKLCLQPTPQLTTPDLNPLSEARDGTASSLTLILVGFVTTEPCWGKSCAFCF